jgi:hypothetical protein
VTDPIVSVWFGERIAFSVTRRSSHADIDWDRIGMLLFLGLGFAQGSSLAFGSIRGDVFMKGTNGEPAVLPGVRIVLHGPINKETESDAQGAFAVD